MSEEDVTEVPPAVIGPREEHDRWRTRTTHSKEDMMKVYRELFFAGFPAPRPYRPDTRPERVAFPRDYVHSFFTNYGAVDHFVYCEERGIGSVTFDTAEAAERCYFNVHLSFLPHPRTTFGRTERRDDDDERDLLLCLEYAWCCPFVNPNLLLLDELQSGEVNRNLLSSFPIIDRHFKPSTASEVVMRWVVAPEGDDDGEDKDTAAEMEDLVLDQLDYDKAVLEAVREYATWPPAHRTTHIPAPLEKPLEWTVTAPEMEFVRRAEAEHFLPQLLDIASYLKFNQLLSLCAAYCAVRIDEIAKAAPSIMDGAEHVRQFLQLENTWTEEETKHLEREMAYAAESYRDVY